MAELSHFRRLAVMGCGNMGAALVRGVAASSGWNPENVTVFDSAPGLAQSLSNSLGVIAADSVQSLLSGADALIAAVKPQVFPQVAGSLAQQVSGRPVLISIMAGLSAGAIHSMAQSAFRVVRTMPNLPLSTGQGATAIAQDGHDENTLAAVEEIFSSVGLTVRVNENQIDAVTGLSGSGPMYVFEFADALISAGEDCGLSRSVSEQLAQQTILGAVALLKSGQTTPSEWTKKVCSPGGTTLAALGVLESRSFKSTLKDAVMAAVARSRELGQ